MKNTFRHTCGLILISISMICLEFCKPAPKAEVIVTEVEQKEPEPPLGECYIVISGNDSILMQVVIEKNSVVGQLHYRYAEKDKSGGTFFGDMRGDTLIADYKFISEGMESEREVAFLKRGEEFIEGYGEAVDQDTRTVFKDISLLKFEGMPMRKTDCEALTWYFKK